MNPQPHPFVGNFCAGIIICLTAFYTYKAYIEGKSISLSELDNFVIGHIQESPVIEKHFYETRTEVTNIENTISTFENQQLYVDCIDTLVALGMKKREAKRKAKFIFSTMKPQPTSIQEFITIALKMPS
jgi:hypothetical protein